MSKVMTLQKVKEQEITTSDSDVIPVSKKNLNARMEAEELKYKQCYDDCVKFATKAKSAKTEIELYKTFLEKSEQKCKNVMNENEIIKKELEVYKSRMGKPIKELETKPKKTANDFNKDVEEEYNRTEKEKLEKLKKELEAKYSF